ncbi:MAG: hypothetical protein Q7U04_13875 [Bacteriovorax sp.]|nr:hypothetical protein [Bacteriovorax sp.]
MGAQKKYIPLPTPEKKKPADDSASNIVQKAEIERMKKLLSEKIKDPKLAKKAALIIAEMLNQKD